MKAKVQPHEPFNQSNQTPAGSRKPFKSGLRVSIGVALFAAISASAQHHVEYGLNISLGPNYYEHYEQGQDPVGPVSHGEGIEGYGDISGIANVGFGVNKARISMSARLPMILRSENGSRAIPCSPGPAVT